MNCPRCGAPSTVLDTRKGEFLTTLRRRRCEKMHVFHTTEAHNAAVSKHRYAFKTFAATTAKRIAQYARDRAISRALRLDGAAVLARRYNLTPSAIYYAAVRGKRNA